MATPHRTPTNFYSRGRSSAARLINSQLPERATPQRPRADITAGRGAAPDYYGPGVALEDGDFNFSDSDGGEASFETDLQFESPHTPYSPHCDITFPINSALSSQSSVEVQGRPPIDAPASNIFAMLQQQQKLLQQVISSQDELKQWQSNVEVKLTELEKKSNTPVAKSPDGKRKRIVTHALSNKVYSLHSELEEQFNGSELFSSTNNKSVKSKLVRDILSQPNCKFGTKDVNLAVKRCYESIRRSYNEGQSGKEDYVEKQAQRRKYRSRRERKFQRRTSVVTKKEMDKYWKHLDLNYVTEESDDPENPNGIVEHKLAWRSKKLDSFMKLLEERWCKNTPQPAGLVAKKVRRTGSPSSSSPPDNAPIWSLIKDIGDKENTPTEAPVV